MLKLAAAIFLPASAVVIAAAALVYFAQDDANEQLLRKRELSSIDLQAGRVAADITTILADLSYLSRKPALQAVLAEHRGSPGSARRARAELAQDALSFSATMQSYDQLRLLDATGRELIRVDFNEGRPEIVPEDELQDKGDRYYFSETFRLAQGEIFVSPLDLNVEHGEIETAGRSDIRSEDPLFDRIWRPGRNGEYVKPMIRFGTPVFDARGQKRGVVLLNYFGARLLHGFSRTDHTRSSQSMLLNSGGYWLSGATPDAEWSFMYDDGGDRSFAKAYPRVWQKIDRQESGQLETADGLFTFMTVSSSSEGLASSPAGIDAKQHRWKAVSHLSAEGLQAQRAAPRRSAALFLISIEILLSGGSWWLACFASRRQWAEWALARSEQRYRVILDSAGEGIYGLDLEGNTTFVNPAAAQMIRWDPEDLIGKPQHSILHHSHPDGTPYPRESCPIYAAFRDGQVRHVDDEVFWRRDGSSFPVEYVSTPIWEDGRVTGAVVTFRDIEAQQHAAMELQRAKQAAEAANQAKSSFLANMSHEIRTPMTAILGFLDLIREGDLTALEQQDHIETVQRNGNHLLAIVNDVLDLAKIEAGHLQMECSLASPSDIVSDVVSLMRERATAKGLAFDVEYRDRLPARIMTDAVRIRQILLNLVSNAIKFTSAGAVRVKVRMLDVGASGEARLRFDVTDSGIGLAPAEQKSIFQPFVQADSTHTRRFGGTGLGLAISLRLAEQLGGTLDLESQPGQGSTFSLTIPTGQLDEVEMVEASRGDTAQGLKSDGVSEAAPERLTGRVLIAEDTPDTRQLIRGLLRKTCLELAEAENGRIACEMASRALEDGEPFDVILMDIQMPEMDGYEATRLLRSQGYEKPIIALTAYAMAEDRERCLAAGCDSYLSKPVGGKALLAVLRAYLHQEKQG